QDRRDLAGSRDSLHIGGIEGKLNLIGMRIQHTLHGVAQIQSAPDRFRSFVIGRDPEGEEGSIDAALAHTRQVGMTVRGAESEILVIDENTLDGIDVCVKFDVLAAERY